MMCSNSF